jgi:hypothetical protein
MNTLETANSAAATAKPMIGENNRDLPILTACS